MSAPPPIPPHVQAALRAGQKIDAIRLMREATGLGLKEAKDAVEAFQSGQAPGTLSPGEVRRGPGAGSVLIAIVAVAALAAAWWLGR